MIESGRLQRAVEKTIAAGYQLDREAFEFLSTIAATDDPTAVMGKALQKMEELEEKPLFINKSFLEALLTQPEPEEKEIQTQPELLEEKLEQTQEPQTPVASSPFHPYAKDVDAKINVIEDPTGKLSSNGTMEEYLQYFQDRFKRMEKLLRQRMDVKAATPIVEALKSPAKTKMKIIGMVSEKREAKQQMILTIEDLQASATILIPSKASEELHRKAQLLLSDQVICAAVTKTRGSLFLAEDIIFPDIGQKPPHRASEPIYAVLTSDIHVGSKKFNKDAFKRFILWLQGKYGDEGMREIASHVKYILIAGDVVDGIGVYPGQAKELAIMDIYTQYRALASYIRRIPEYIEVLIIPGDHDAAPKALPQPAISKEYAGELSESKRVHLLPDPCMVSIHGVEVLMYHGRSLIDVASCVPGISMNEAYKAMKVLVQSRHLAPTYGQRTLIVPIEHDCLVIDRVPDILHTGHLHLLKHEIYRGVLMVNSGCWQAQTEYQEKSGIVPKENVVPVVNLQTMQVFLMNFGN
jgi:DNA polymerase II small subunit